MGDDLKPGDSVRWREPQDHKLHAGSVVGPSKQHRGAFIVREHSERNGLIATRYVTVGYLLLTKVVGGESQ